MAIDFSKYGTKVDTTATKGGIAKPAVSPTTSPFAKYGTPVDVSQETVPKKEGFIKTLAKDIARPVATLAARPFQLAKAFGGATEEEQSVELPFGLGRAETVKTGKDVLKDVGRAAQTVSLGVGGAIPKVGAGVLGRTAFGRGVQTVAGKLATAPGAIPVVKGAALTRQPLGALIRQGAGIGAKGGALSEGGRSIEEGKDLGGVITDTAIGGAFGLGAGVAIPAALRGVGKPFGGIISRFATPKLERFQNAINKESDELLSKTKGIIGKTQILSEGRNIPVDKYIKDPHIFKGLNVENSRINPDGAVATVRNRIDILMDSKAKLLPELDRITPKKSKEIIRQKAISNLKGTPADILDDTSKINRQLDALPDELSVSEIDTFRAQARQSARDAKGLSKTNEYAAIEKATRDTVFDITDNLPFDTNKEFQSINNEIKNLIGMEEFLDKTIRGQIVKGGRLTNVVGRVVGAIAGSKGGPLGAIAGSEVGGVIADIITNTQLGNSMKMKLIRNITDDPAVLKEAEKFLLKVMNYKPPQLPAPAAGAFRTQIGSGETIRLPSRIPSTVEAQEIARIQAQRSQGIEITPKDLSTIQQPTKIASKISIPESIAQEPYIPQDKLPVIKFGSKPKPQKSDLPVIEFGEKTSRQARKIASQRPESFGAVGGIERDKETGEIKFNPEKAILGIGAIAAFKKGQSNFGKGKALSAKEAIAKGMTEEQYVKGQGITLYHGTNAKFDKFDISMAGEVQNADWGDGIYFTDNPTHAKSFAKVAGGDIVMERFAPNVKFADGSKLLKDSKFMDALDDGMGFVTPSEYLKAKGFGGIKYNNPQGFTEYVVYDPSKLKPTSQLRAEYQTAKGLSKPSSAQQAVKLGGSVFDKKKEIK